MANPLLVAMATAEMQEIATVLEEMATVAAVVAVAVTTVAAVTTRVEAAEEYVAVLAMAVVLREVRMPVKVVGLAL